MATRKTKGDGIEALVAKKEPVSIQDITMLDWYAGFALIGINQGRSEERIAIDAFEVAEAMMKERERRIG